MSTFQSIKLRIGAKLAITAGFGVLMVAAMVLNQIRVNASSQALSAQAASSESMLRSVLTAEVALRRTIIMNRDIRMATTLTAVDQSAGRLDQFVKDGKQALDRAISRATLAEDRGALTKSNDLFDRYVTSMRETAVVQREAVDLLQKQSQQGLDWGKKFSDFMALPGFANEPKRAELVRTLEHADGVHQLPRLEGFRRFGRRRRVGGLLRVSAVQAAVAELAVIGGDIERRDAVPLP